MAIEVTLSMSLVGKAKIANAKVIELQQQVQALANDATDAEKATVEYVLNVIEQAAASNEITTDFITEKGTSILFSSDLRDQVIALLEENFRATSATNLDEVRITGKQSYAAAQALLELFNTFNTLIPDERMAKVHHALNKKMNQPPKITSLAEFNLYIGKRCGEISKEPSRNTRIAAYQELKTFSEKKYTELTSKTYQFMQSFDSNYEHTQAAIDDIAKTLLQEASDGFDVASKPFEEQITSLRTRSEEITHDEEKNRFTNAIMQAQSLIENVNEIKQTLQETGDLVACKQAITTLFDEFPGKADFDKNRSNRWFRTLIIEPFEKFKAFINNMLNGPAGQTNLNPNSFFQAKKTGTTQSFEALQKDLKELGKDENSEPRNAG